MDSFKKEHDASLWSQMRANDKVNTVLSFIRGAILFYCAVVTSLAFGMDSNSCVLFIVVATSMADIAMSLSTWLSQGKPRTTLRGFVFGMTLVCVLISEIYADNV